MPNRAMNQNTTQLGIKEIKKNEKNPGIKSLGFVFVFWFF